MPPSFMVYQKRSPRSSGISRLTRRSSTRSTPTPSVTGGARNESVVPSKPPSKRTLPICRDGPRADQAALNEVNLRAQVEQTLCTAQGLRGANPRHARALACRCERVLFPEVLPAHKGLGKNMPPINSSTIAIPKRILRCLGSSSRSGSALQGSWSKYKYHLSR